MRVWLSATQTRSMRKNNHAVTDNARLKNIIANLGKKLSETEMIAVNSKNEVESYRIVIATIEQHILDMRRQYGELEKSMRLQAEHDRARIQILTVTRDQQATYAQPKSKEFGDLEKEYWILNMTANSGESALRAELTIRLLAQDNQSLHGNILELDR
ncbi:MAG: hypothetical protein ACKPKO_18840, partial [Candidatus Fonsibacter sp.]